MNDVDTGKDKVGPVGEKDAPDMGERSENLGVEGFALTIEGGEEDEAHVGVTGFCPFRACKGRADAARGGVPPRRQATAARAAAG